MRTRSFAICTELDSGDSFEPGISCQLTETSPIGIPWRRARKRSSMSKHHRSTCIAGKRRRAARRSNSLKPHCVSRMPRTHSCTSTWKPYMRIFRSTVRCATASSCRWARDPITTAPLALSNFAIAASSFSRSDIFVAPSASTISNSRPRALNMPSLTAPPLPLLRSASSRRTLEAPSRDTYLPATADVPSRLPSLTMIISHEKFFTRVDRRSRYSIVSSSMTGRRSCSLYAGTTSERSTVGSSNNEGKSVRRPVAGSEYDCSESARGRGRGAVHHSTATPAAISAARATGTSATRSMPETDILKWRVSRPDQRQSKRRTSDREIHSLPCTLR
eukprot:Opistho-2@88771